ncbi:FISUMP domain-containing protein [Telluribacter humicola]|uniref:FISUMP domain-containing protein n=1 Tax=Telluribacter humicola TaxID=1720261 RepID=UPI001A975761|nr:FISUMP domain-containing protein [Telluribacter humicola]
MKNYITRSTILAVFLLAILFTSCRNEGDPQPNPQPQPQLGSVLIDGKSYPTVTIGDLTWTAANHTGTGGVAYNSSNGKPEYGRYYTFEEAKAVPLPAGWRMPTIEDYKKLAQSQGVTFTGDRAINQDALKKLVSVTNWRKIAGTNASGFNAYPGGYCFREAAPQDGDISEYWTVGGQTMSIMESANGLNHNMSFYDNSDSPEYRFNLRFVKNK